ncbi:hypothetical protein [Winogradskyella sediminis]|uniref:hypothetical protein n=1 Tax=Winogradskyella sediminis TaxID=1382466 RepID=UPI003AA9A4DD
MKKLVLTLLLCVVALQLNAQSCEEIMEYVKEQSTGTTYTSYTSEAISKVTFYTITVDYKTLYFAIVCFKQKYSYGCSEYIYQVGSSTKLNYSMNYLSSAGKAFHKYINPYNKSLKCAPDFE